MNFEEHAAKPLLAAAGITTPEGRLCHDADEAAVSAAAIGPCVVKAQVPTGKRGKAGGIKRARGADEARSAASAILGMTIDGHAVKKVLVEAQVPIARELYAAVLNDQATKGPLLLFSTRGGMDIEELAAQHPDQLLRLPIDIRHGIDRAALRDAIGDQDPTLINVLLQLYEVYRTHDTELIEINPLAVTTGDEVVALDCKFVLDDSGSARQAELAANGVPEKLTVLEAKAREHGLKYIELDGEVGVLANGAGLTMTTMDAIRHYGGRPANFLEIGGEAYTLGKPALEAVVANPKVKSLLINFCGAFARTDVMVGGLIEAWAVLPAGMPVFFSIHGTGEDEAVALVRDRLGIEPFDLMDDAVKAAVAAAR